MSHAGLLYSYVSVHLALMDDHQSHEEFKQNHLASQPMDPTVQPDSGSFGRVIIPSWDTSPEALAKLPDHVDWRTKGWVSDVHDQVSIVIYMASF